MALSDCVNCWTTPCVCGHEYRKWSPQQLKKQIAMLQKVMAEKTGEDATALVSELRESAQLLNSIKRIMFQAWGGNSNKVCSHEEEVEWRAADFIERQIAEMECLRAALEKIANETAATWVSEVARAALSRRSG